MSSDSNRVANFLPNFFETSDPERARELILTKNFTMSTDERWQQETPYLCERLGLELGLKESDTVLDFGCGVGRLAKAIIEKYKCTVIGVDTSASMREMATGYVDSSRFRALSSEHLDAEVANGLKLNHGYAVWVLQHVADLKGELARLARSIAPQGGFYLVTAPGRCVPCDLGWVNDGADIFTLTTEAGFKEMKRERLTLYPQDDAAERPHWCVTYTRV